MKIHYTDTPDIQDVDFLTQRISEATPDFGEMEAFGLFIRDENEQIIAGCNGTIFYGTIYTDQLWVHSDYRSRGLGVKLINQVHDLGRQKNCTFACLLTFDFQNARPFYEKLGYYLEFERTKGHVNNSVGYVLRKEL